MQVLGRVPRPAGLLGTTSLGVGKLQFLQRLLPSEPGTSAGRSDPHPRYCRTAGSQCSREEGFDQRLTYSSGLRQHLYAALLAVALPQINPLSLKGAKGRVSSHVSNPSVVLGPSFNTQEFPGWELVSHPSRWETTRARACCERPPLPEPGTGLREAPGAAGTCRPLKASPVASGFVSSHRVMGKGDISLREKAAADAEMFPL